MLEVYPTLFPEFFFTCGPGNEKRRLVLGALIQNLKNEASVRNSLLSLIQVDLHDLGDTPLAAYQVHVCWAVCV